jgi:hypothetical protein
MAVPGQCILDLDLDFFLDEIAHSRPDKEKRLPASWGYKRWKKAEVRSFLEQQCLLSTANPIKGRVVTHHDEVFWLWRELIKARSMRVPFSLVHVDAHADLGMGDAAYVYVMTELLHLSLEDRKSPNNDQVLPGNFLLFAVACRWVSQITFVLHPKWHMDLPSLHFQNFTTKSECLELKKCTGEEFRKHILRDCWDDLPVLGSEPKVPFQTIPSSEYQAKEPFSFVFLSHSPNYTPKSADGLISVVKEYISEI